ncbi:hypothetical protein ACFXAO_37875 [Streptomyces lavendulae]|uniref:hypothetical protein n=1 Tax=Streptomyces lavendulae TaxID=1914 RepID=UPI00368F84EA
MEEGPSAHGWGELLGFAAAVAVGPLMITALILILAMPQGRLNGILFTICWILGLSALGCVLGLALAALKARNAPPTVAAGAAIG